MATNKPSRRRLVLCGVCFREDCPWSKWIDEDGDVADLIDQMHVMFLESQHTEEEEQGKLTAEERNERIKEVIEANGDIEIANLDELLGSSVKGVEKSPDEFIKTDKGSFLDDILRNASEQIERQDGGEQTKGH